MEKQIKKSIDKIIIEAVQGTYSIFAWKSLNGAIEKCEMKIKAFRKEYNEIELEIVEKESKKLSDIISGDRELNFYLPEFSVSFTSHLKKTIDEKKLKILIPEEFEFFERRKHERVQAKKSSLTFELNKMNYKKPMFDISMGGFAIVLPKTERVQIKKGQTFENCIIEINARKFKVNAECVSMVVIDRFKLESLPYGGHKIAFRFTKIDEADRDFIAEIVTQEAISNKQLKGA